MREIHLTVPSALSDAAYHEICDGFQEIYEDVFFADRQNDDALIAGFVADIDGEIIDTSLKTQLKRMKEHLIASCD